MDLNLDSCVDDDTEIIWDKSMALVAVRDPASKDASREEKLKQSNEGYKQEVFQEIVDHFKGCHNVSGPKIYAAMLGYYDAMGFEPDFDQDEIEMMHKKLKDAILKAPSKGKAASKANSDSSKSVSSNTKASDSSSS